MESETETKKEEKQKITIKDSVLEGIKEIHTSGGLIEDDYFNKLKIKRLETPKSYIAIADLFLECYDCLECITPKLIVDSVDYKKDMDEYLIKFINYVRHLRDLFNEYDNGESIGDYAIKYRIEKDVQENREVYFELIKSFFKIFGEDA